MKTIQVIIIGACILVAAITHALLRPNRPMPIQTGYSQGEIWKQEAAGIAHLKCNGFRVECYESFVVVHVDKEKEPTWTDNYVLTIPWDKIEHLTLMPE